MQNKLKKIILIILNFFEKTTKKENILIFSSFPDLSDNTYALFNYLIKNGYEKKYKLIWFVKGSNINMYSEMIKEKYGENSTIICKTNSILGVYYYLKSKHVFYTHGLFTGIKPITDKRIDLCHGMPLKSYGTYMGAAMKISSKGIATSKKFQEIMSKALDLNLADIIISGQPRNDLLFESTNFFEKVKINIEEFYKIIMWMPTYRKSDSFQDVQGIYQEKKIGEFTVKELEELNNYLIVKKILVIIKLHPLDILIKEKYSEYSNIKIVTNKDFEKVNEQLYPVLGKCDALITDYSSVYIDFLILNKPIGFTISDISEYEKSRGFIFETPTQMMPGKFIKSKIDFYEFLDKIVENIDEYKRERKEVNSLFNKYTDNKSSERLLKALGIF